MFDLMNINPGLWVILAGLLCALIPTMSATHYIRKALLIVAPIFAGWLIFQMHSLSPEYIRGVLIFGNIDLTTLRIDGLSLVWGYLFCLAGVINGLYGLHEKCRITDSTALIYTGAAIAGVLAGDMITLFIFWELTAISSVFLVWKGGDRAYAAGVRYLAIQVLSGVLLLGGAIMVAQDRGGDFMFDYIGLDTPGGWLMLIAIGIKCGFPLLNNWIQDAYPKASITGTVILASFTTKFAIYALARGYEGVDILVWIGAIMACLPVFFIAVENDLRRVLAYSLNSQLGFMVVGIGIGSALAMNGVIGQVFVHVIFKGLLFMSLGAVMYRTGTAKLTELGGLFRSMPYTTMLCLIGACTIAAMPMLAAFVTKAMILSAAVNAGLWGPYAMLLFAAAGVTTYYSIKVPYFTFFAKDSGRRVKEAPWNMLLAMSLAAILCVVLAWPFGGYQMLYALMPFELDYPYKPYTWDHVVFQLQLLFAAVLAFALLKRLGAYPANSRAEILDFDWVYRRMGFGAVKWGSAMWDRLDVNVKRYRNKTLNAVGRKLYQVFSPAGAMSEAAPSGLSAVLTAGMLLLTLIVIYVLGA